MKILLLISLVAFTHGSRLPEMFLKDSMVVLPQKFLKTKGACEIDCTARCEADTAEGTCCQCNGTDHTIAPPAPPKPMDNTDCELRCQTELTPLGCDCNVHEPTLHPPRFLDNVDCEQRCKDHTTEGTNCNCGTPGPTIAPPFFKTKCDLNCDQRCKDDTAEGTCCQCGSTEPTIHPPLMVTGPFKAPRKLDPFSPTCIQRCAAGQGEPICDCGSDGPNEQSARVERLPKKAISPGMVYKRQRIPPIENHYP